jgi:hypothetical protein
MASTKAAAIRAHILLWNDVPGGDCWVMAEKPFAFASAVRFVGDSKIRQRSRIEKALPYPLFW